MTGHPETPAAQPVAPTPPKTQPETLPRRRCDNCGKFFPLTQKNRKFCKTQCKDEFHNHGAAFGPLKVTLTKLVEKITREALTPEALMKAGFFHRSKFKRVPAEQTGAHLLDDVKTLGHAIGKLLQRVHSLENPPTEESPAALRGYLDTLAGLIGGLDKRLAVVEISQRVLAGQPEPMKFSQHHHRRGQAKKKAKRRAR